MNYLKEELYSLVKSDSSIFDFLQFAALDGLWYWDVEQPEEEWMNARFWEVLGYDPGVMPHKSSAWQDIIFQEDLETALENFGKHCADASHPYDQTVRYRHADGHTVYIRCRGMAIRDDAGTAKRMLGAHTDITSVMNARDAMIQLEREAVLSRVVGPLAHNFNNKLTVIMGAADLLGQTRPDADSMVSFANQILQAAEEMSGAIGSMLALSSDERLEPGHHSVAYLSDRLAQRARGLAAPDCTVRVKLSAAGRSDLSVELDEIHLELCVAELVKNAVAAAGEDGMVEITVDVQCRASRDCLAVHVTDDGPGIPEAEKGRVYEPFYSTKAESAGAGLGLTYVERVVRRMGGELVLSNRHSGGVEAGMFFPISE